ncbi:MAG: hypothetical protein HQL95_04820 [Magnetococcales bacterium]|nr:hypothetical protein [Magnetococcales bacterium]
MKLPTYPWAFVPRFRRNGFGWRSQPAIQRVKEAVAEIKKIAKTDSVLGGEGAVIFLEKVVPAIEQVDSSSGAMGTAVRNAMVAMVPIIAQAEVDEQHRGKWLERIWKAYQEDGYGYLDDLGEVWGEICGTREKASEWADRLIDSVRAHWKERRPGGYYHGVSACLSSLFKAERYEELLALLEGAPHTFWHYHRFGFLALGRISGKEAAMAFAEKCRHINDQHLIDQDCEEYLLSIGEMDEAYQRYAMRSNRASTHINTFRAVVKKYPRKDPTVVLMDLIESTPGQEGKWFATARQLGFRDLALHLAGKSPCDPHTLNRAARDTVVDDPEFAMGVAMASLHWLCQGYGYEITGMDVLSAYRLAIQGAEQTGRLDQVKQQITALVTGKDRDCKFVRDILTPHLR